MEVHTPVQRDNQFEIELFQLKQEFENNLRCYEGNDPLNIWYEYIMKIEDCHLQNGTIHYILPVLEKCLEVFKTDNRYTNDRRHCKLWIKYTSLQQANQIELFISLHSSNICTKCADLYQAWALYHELAGDFKQANMVFDMGKRFFAEPAEELDIAQKKMVFMAGLHTIFGPDELRLFERKKELNSLHRTKFHNQHTFYNTCQIRTQGLPAFDVRYLTNTTDMNGSSSIVKSEENTIVPKVEKVYEGIRLYPDFAPVNHDDYSDWIIERFLPDPDANLPDKRCMYLKHEVYKDNTEYSPEEIQARRYFAKKKQISQISETDHHMSTETNRAVESIIHEDKKTVFQTQNQNQIQNQNQNLSTNQNVSNIQQNQSYYPNVTHGSSQSSKFLGFSPHQNYNQQINEKGDGAHYAPQNVVSYEDKKNLTQTHSWQTVTKTEDNNSFIKELWKDESIVQVPKPEFQAFQIHEDTKLLKDETIKHSPLQPKVMSNVKQPFAERQFSAEKPQHFTPQNYHPGSQIAGDLFGNSENHHQSFQNQRTPVKNENQPFPNYQQQQQPFMSPNFVAPDPRTPKGHKYLSQPLPETHKESPHVFSQPEFAHPREIKKNPAEIFHLFDDVPTSVNINESTCNTQVFNFNLKSSSTPFNEKKLPPQFVNHHEIKSDHDQIENHEMKVSSKQRLFEEKNVTNNEKWYTPNHHQGQDKLSIILESTKELCSSSGSSSSGTTLKTTSTFNGYSLKMIPEDAMEINNSQTQGSKIYVQNPHQINQSAFGNQSSYRIPQVNHTQQSYLEASYRMNLPNKTTSPKTPSPQKELQYSKYNSMNVPREEMSVRRSQIGANDASCICIDDTNLNLSTEIPPNMQFDTLKSPYQSQQYNAKVPRERKVERDRFETSKNLEGLVYEGSNDSNSLKDLWGRSPAKGSRMDIDVLSQHSNPDLRMDYDSCPEPPVDESILLRTPSDPFSSKITKALLRKVGFPQQRHMENYVTLQKIPRLISKETIVLGDERYTLAQIIGKGTYGQVFKATRLSTSEIVAMKFQKPMNQWEFYICSEIQHRIRNPHVLKAFMSVDVGYFCPTSSILVSEFCRYGSLLDLSNKVKQMTGKGLKELVVIYFANEIITIINALHQCQIIHADIKPDNFLVTRMPPDYGHPCIQLIDFGCSIDMTLFPKGQTFKKVVNTENFTCPEMKDGKPWSYQTDIFCAAATVHVLLFEKYLQLQKKDSIWCISNKVPRYLRSDLWNTFFFQMLNIESCDKLPDLNLIKKSFEIIISEQSEELQMEMRNIGNSVNGR